MNEIDELQSALKEAQRSLIRAVSLSYSYSFRDKLETAGLIVFEVLDDIEKLRDLADRTDHTDDSAD